MKLTIVNPSKADPETLRKAAERTVATLPPPADLLPLWTLDEILDYQPDPTSQIWPGGILTAGDAAAIVGAPGVGKTRMALQAALCTISGRPFLCWETNGARKKWLFLQTENNGERLKHDLQRMTAGLTAEELALVHESLRILKIDVMDFGSICMMAGHPDRVRIERTLAAWQPDIVVIDPLRDAGQGDPNKDDCMMETCRSISEVVKRDAPKRVPLVIHHGRTGAVEASKVWGDDSGSFARNSKVMYGWLRSQINVAAAGVAHPGVIIVGCGKCSNGRKWQPFAARLDEETMMYQVLTVEEFDLEEWAGGMGGTGRGKPQRTITPDEVADVLRKNGGTLRGGIQAEAGLVAQVRRAFSVSRDHAAGAVESALGITIEYSGEARPAGKRKGQSGGSPVTVYNLKRPAYEPPDTGPGHSDGDA